MRLGSRLGAAAMALAALTTAIAGFAAAASAQPGGDVGSRGVGPSGHAVFVQTDNIAGNQVVSYDRAANGTLSAQGTYNTGGLGGVLNGSAVDHLASQGTVDGSSVGRFLYVQTGKNGIVDEFHVNATGTLTSIGSVVVPGAVGGEGIVAS